MEQQDQRVRPRALAKDTWFGGRSVLFVMCGRRLEYQDAKFLCPLVSCLVVSHEEPHDRGGGHRRSNEDSLS